MRWENDASLKGRVGDNLNRSPCTNWLRLSGDRWATLLLPTHEESLYELGVRVSTNYYYLLETETASPSRLGGLANLSVAGYENQEGVLHD